MRVAAPFLLAGLVLMTGACSREEEPVANRFAREEARIENKARELEAEVDREVKAAEARLENEADALIAARNQAEANEAAQANSVR